MGARFIGGDRDQVFLMPPSVRDWVPEGHLVWTVLDAVGEWTCRRFTPSIALTGVVGFRALSSGLSPSAMVGVRRLSVPRRWEPPRSAVSGGTAAARSPRRVARRRPRA